MQSLLELLAPSVCPACDAERPPRQPLLCAACRAGFRPLPRLGEVCTAVAYTGTGAILIKRFKFQERRDALRVLLGPTLERARTVVGEKRLDGVLAIPRHLDRVRALGCDPTHELARGLARAIGLPLLDRTLLRTRPTPPQAGLPLQERFANVRASFRAEAGSLRRRRILLLDDVTTSGATLAAAREALQQASGVETIVRMAAAGTPLPPHPAAAAL